MGTGNASPAAGLTASPAPREARGSGHLKASEIYSLEKRSLLHPSSILTNVGASGSPEGCTGGAGDTEGVVWEPPAVCAFWST